MQPVQARAEVLAALEAVDLVVVFDEDTPEKLIARVKPTVLVKGGDYTREQVVGRDIVEALGGEVVLIDIVPGHSTSAMVERTRAEGAVNVPRLTGLDRQRFIGGFWIPACARMSAKRRRPAS